MHGGTIVSIEKETLSPADLMHKILNYNINENKQRAEKNTRVDDIEYDKETGRYTLTTPIDKNISYFHLGQMKYVIGKELEEKMRSDPRLSGYELQYEEVDGNKFMVAYKDGVRDDDATRKVRYMKHRVTAKNEILNGIRKQIQIETYNEASVRVNDAFNKLMNMEPMTKVETDILKGFTLESTISGSPRDLAIRKALELRNIIDLATENALKNSSSFSKEFDSLSANIASGNTPHCRFCGKFISKDASRCNNCGNSNSIETGFQSIIITPLLNSEKMREAYRLAALVRDGVIQKGTFDAEFEKKKNNVFERNVKPEDLVNQEMYSFADGAIKSNMATSFPDLTTKDFELNEFDPMEDSRNGFRNSNKYPYNYDYKKDGGFIIGMQQKRDDDDATTTKLIRFGDKETGLQTRPEFDDALLKDLSQIGNWRDFDNWTAMERDIALSKIRTLNDKYGGRSIENKRALLMPLENFKRFSSKKALYNGVNLSKNNEFVTDGRMMMKNSSMKSNRKYMKDASDELTPRGNVTNEMMGDFLNALPKENMEPISPSGAYLTNRMDKRVVFTKKDGTMIEANLDTYKLIADAVDFDTMQVQSDENKGVNFIQFKKGDEIVAVLGTSVMESDRF